MKTHVLELSCRCQSLIQLYKNEFLILYHACRGKCHYEQCKHLEVNLASFAPLQALLK